MVAEADAGPFIYTPYLDKEKGKPIDDIQVQWVCGETAVVEVEISNPTAVAVKVCRWAL